ncbi:MAG: ectonucleotide pyrophosphatase/phosphodiesterase [Bacteroidales bacterium]|jgi:alkaline phosphatase D|nr:ectonucleotide pyrophosphatase/phosphodiesterase [Bacteroidales bacterium]
MKKVLFSTVLICLTLSCFFGQTSNDEKQYVIVLSMDAFRWDYDQLVGTPNLDAISRKGVKAKAFQSSFPTVTFPNHYSMATGLYPDHHGIISNTFFNKALQKEYKIANYDVVGDPAFYGGEPIWNTAQKQGVLTANYFWVGSETPINGMHPNIWKKFDKTVTYSQRIDSVMSWLERPESERPQLIMFYFEDPDATSHFEDPAYGEKTHLMVKYCDSLVGVLDEKLQALPFAKNIHLLVVSDHGMCPVDSTRAVCLPDYLDTTWIQYSNWSSPMCLMDIYPDKLDSALLILKNIPHIQAWKPADVPKRLNFGTNPNIGNLVILADSAWSLTKTPRPGKSGGAHGFDNLNRDMYGIFYGYGPKFAKNKVVPEFPNIQLYNIIAHLLGIEPVETDAKLEDVEFLFE